jgi:hypothetical protein
MRKRIITILLLFSFCGLLYPNKAKAQDNFLSIGLSHPIPVGDTFYSGFNGVGGIDIKYAQPINDYLFLSGNLGYLRSRYTQDDQINLSMFRVSLGLSTPINFSPRIKFQPELEFGYTMMRFFSETIAQENETSSLHRTESAHLPGWQSAILLSWNYKLNKKFSLGLITGYEFIYIPRGIHGRPYNQEMHSIGLGLKTIINLP